MILGLRTRGPMGAENLGVRGRARVRVRVSVRVEVGVGVGVWLGL